MLYIIRQEPFPYFYRVGAVSNTAQIKLLYYMLSNPNCEMAGRPKLWHWHFHLHEPQWPTTGVTPLILQDQCSVIQHRWNLYYIDCQITILRRLEDQYWNTEKCLIQILTTLPKLQNHLIQIRWVFFWSMENPDLYFSSLDDTYITEHLIPVPGRSTFEY